MPMMISNTFTSEPETGRLDESAIDIHQADQFANQTVMLTLAEISMTAARDLFSTRAIVSAPITPSPR